MKTVRNHGQISRASAGPRARSLSLDEVTARRAALLAEPASPARTAGLAKVRQQLQTIRSRVASL